MGNKSIVEKITEYILSLSAELIAESYIQCEKYKQEVKCWQENTVVEFLKVYKGPGTGQSYIKNDIVDYIKNNKDFLNFIGQFKDNVEKYGNFEQEFIELIKNKGQSSTPWQMIRAMAITLHPTDFCQIADLSKLKCLVKFLNDEYGIIIKEYDISKENNANEWAFLNREVHKYFCSIINQDGSTKLVEALAVKCNEVKETINAILNPNEETNKKIVIDKAILNHKFIMSFVPWEFYYRQANAQELAKRIETCKNLILTGAPGTGKTYLAKEEIANHIARSSTRIGFVQFHPSYDYADFVEGLRPKEYNGQVTFELVDGTFKKFCEKALVDWIAWMVKKIKNLNNDYEFKKIVKDASKEDLSRWLSEWKEYKTAITDYTDFPKYVFIIDEINRGEMSKIFGELFYSIEPGYRGTKGGVSTQYANMVKEPNLFDCVLNNDKMGQFFIPENVYIIGTMNDIDRSVESMDFAFRRRFTFIEITAEESEGMLWQLGNKLSKAKAKMNALNEALVDEEKGGLTTAYQLGGSYFLKLNDVSFDELWEYYIKGTLYEYFRGEPDAEQRMELLKKVYNNA